MTNVLSFKLKNRLTLEVLSEDDRRYVVGDRYAGAPFVLALIHHDERGYREIVWTGTEHQQAQEAARRTYGLPLLDKTGGHG